MNSRFLTAALIAVPALVALKPLADSVQFQPEDGSSASKEYSINIEFSLGDLSVVIDGQDMSENIPADLELTSEILMSVTDQYVATLDGRPLELIRTFDSLSMTWESPDDSGEDEDIADLEGKSVLFTWNEDDEGYDKSFHESEGDEDDLDDLSVEMDMQALLPGDDVSEGDTWVVDSSRLGSLIIFGTDPGKFDLSDLGDGDEVGALLGAELEPQLMGLADSLEAECEYMGTRDVDGETVGVIAVRLSGEGEIDLSSMITELADSQAPEGLEFDLSVDEAVISIMIEGEGELLWNLESGLFQSYDMTAEIELLADVAISADVQGESFELEASAEVLGLATWTAEVN